MIKKTMERKSFGFIVFFFQKIVKTTAVLEKFHNDKAKFQRL